MSWEYRVGDVFERLAEIPDGSIDLIVTSPPFLALRSYLPADHPDKHKEIGSEPTPAEFIDTLLALSAEWGRVLAPHGSLCVELGDTYSGSGGGGGDYLPGGIREGQQQFAGSAAASMRESNAAHWRAKNAKRDAWPLAKSMCLVPHLYTTSLAYGRNLLTGDTSPAGAWRIRNVICWARPNPPVGALGDKFRPATSYITVACKGTKRYFDLDAVRTKHDHQPHTDNRGGHRRDGISGRTGQVMNPVDENGHRIQENVNGAPPLDWHAEEHPEDGDWLWKMPTKPYKGSHYAAFPLDLPQRLIEAMCPQRVCTECGKPSERITEPQPVGTRRVGEALAGKGIASGDNGNPDKVRFIASNPETVGWTDCGHGVDAKRPGVVLDPFAGSGTTIEAALAVGRHAIGIDLDARNADLATQRVGMFLEVVA